MCTAFFILGGGGDVGSSSAGTDARDGGPSATSTSSSSSAPPLLLLFNRDEYFDRETAAAAFWEPDHPHLLAGRDLRRGGTWMGVTRGGRWAIVLNFREMNFDAGPGAPSRGVLPTDFLTGASTPLEYLAGIDVAAHNGFNLVVGDLGQGNQAAYLTNRGPPGAPGHWTPTLLGPGVYGLSNGPLGSWTGGGSGDEEGGPQTGWAKVDAGVAALVAMLRAGELAGSAVADPAALPWARLFGSGLMGCPTRSTSLPATGVPPHIEAALSSTFVPATPDLFGAGTVYGTRCQTGLAVAAGGRAVLVERSAAVAGDGGGGGGRSACESGGVPVTWTEVRHEWRLEAGVGGGLVVDEAGGCASPDEGGGGGDGGGGLVVGV